MKKLLPLLSVLFLIYWSCEEEQEQDSESCNSDCSIYIYSQLPLNSDGVYELPWNENLVQTYSHLYVETNCGLHNRVQWDSDYQYQIGGEWVSLINPSSMTDEDGKGTIVYGFWEEFIGLTVTFYGGYYDHCNNQFVDSVKVKLIES